MNFENYLKLVRQQVNINAVVENLQKFKSPTLVCATNEYQWFARLLANALNVQNNIITDMCSMEEVKTKRLSNYKNVLLINTTMDEVKNNSGVSFIETIFDFNFEDLSKHEADIRLIYSLMAYILKDEETTFNYVSKVLNSNNIIDIKKDKNNVIVCDSQFSSLYYYFEYNLLKKDNFAITKVNKYDILDGKVTVLDNTNLILIKGDQTLDKVWTKSINSCIIKNFTYSELDFGDSLLNVFFSLLLAVKTHLKFSECEV